MQVFDYDWSPDGSGWPTPAWTARSPASCTSCRRPAARPKNVTRYATYNGDVTWSKDGKKLGFVSQRPRVAVAVRHVAAEAGRRRAPRPAATSTGTTSTCASSSRPAPPVEEGAISPDGTKVAFRSHEPDGRSTCGSPACRGGQRHARHHRQHAAAADPVVEAAHRPRSTSATAPARSAWPAPAAAAWMPAVRPVQSGGDAATLPFRVKMTVRRDEEFAEMFEQSWRALAENFYDAEVPRRRLERRPRQVPAAGQARRHEGRPVRPDQPDAGRAERLAPGHQRLRLACPKR